jgi:putative membrane-bound dehydrogenase-like protein
MNRVIAVGCLCFSLVRFTAEAAEPTLSSNDLPRFAPVSPEAALQTFEVKKGFHLELVAAEPKIVSPVALSFDENGRMYVVEMVDYSERRDETPHLGRIRLLEDIDGDGVYETSTIFATNLAWPTAVFCYDGGVFVAATPDILYLKDTNGDGKADVQQKVFTGFAEGLDRINVQAMLNTFLWGLDNRIHGATSGNGGLVRALRHPDAKVVDLHGRDFVIEPRTLSITSEAGGGQHGLSFNDAGRRFACNNSDHIRLFMYDDVYAARNPFYSMPAPLVSIAVDGPAAEVYRISPEEPWRVIRTRWRVAGLVPGPIEGGGRASGYFTGATGTTIYRGDAFPPEYLGNAFVADCGGNLIHRKVLIPNGVELKAQRPADEQTVEFIASRDTWFRPVQFANAPDGTLYVIDMYREVIEHPWSLPSSIKKLVDLNSGNDRGRIYRIAPDGFKRPGPPRLGQASTAELVATLEDHNGWHRDTASRLLYERQDPAAIPLLNQLIERSAYALARMHALYVLDGLGALTVDHVRKGLNDPEAVVREHAVKLSEKFLHDGAAPAPIASKLQTMVADDSEVVRFQLAFTLGEMSKELSLEPVATLTRRDGGSYWPRAAILSSIRDNAGELFVLLTKDSDFCNSKGGQDFLQELAGVVGSRNDRKEVASVLRFVSAVEEPGIRFGLIRALGDGLKDSRGSAVISEELFRNAFGAATGAATNLTYAEGTRVAAIRLLGLSSYADSGTTLLSLLGKNEPQPIQLAVVGSLNRFADPAVGPELIKMWDQFSPRLRSEAVSTLLARPDRAAAMLHALQKGSIEPNVLGTTQAKFLRTHPDSAVRQLAEQVLGAVPSAQRQNVIDAFLPALNLRPDAAGGKKIYEQRCISCHRLGGEGHALGPDLVTVKNTGKEKLLVNILDPNREVRPDFISYVVETKDGESLVGLVANETSTTLTVRQAYGKEDVVPRAQIRKMRSQGQSLMPEGLEAGLTPQELANLLEYIETAGP